METCLQLKYDNLHRVLQAIGQAPAGLPLPARPLASDGSFDGKPLLLWLETTARCNLRCAKCGHSFDPPGEPRSLPRNLPDAVVDAADPFFAAAVKVRTSGYGEMFLYNRLQSLVDRLKRYECWVEGTTNGVLIHHTEADWLVDLGYDQLVFSIDGVEPSTMQRLRGADLNKIWDILRYIKQRKTQTGRVKPRIVVGFVAQADNLHELPALVRKLAEFDICFIAVNSLHYKKYLPGTHDPYAELYHHYSLANLPRDRTEALIDEGRRLAGRLNIGYGVYIDLDRVYREASADPAPEDPEDNDQTGGRLVNIPLDTGWKPARPLEPFYCVYPWTTLFVTARGSTSVCCSMRGDIGDVSISGDLERVWNGPALREIRRNIAAGQIHPNCAYCVSRNRHMSSFVDLEEARSVLASWQSAPAETAPAELPAEPVFGYVDAAAGRFFLRARSLERVLVSGWVTSRAHGSPVREVRLTLEGQLLGAVRHFHTRPDVAAHFHRPDLLHSGWQAHVQLPALPPGRYALVVEATDSQGVSGALDPWPVEIVE